MSLTIYVKLYGEEISLEVTQHETVADLRRRAEEAFGVEVESLQLEGETLETMDGLLQDEALQCVVSEKALGTKTLSALGGQVNTEDYNDSILSGNIERVTAYVKAGYSTNVMSKVLESKSVCMLETLVSLGMKIDCYTVSRLTERTFSFMRIAELFTMQESQNGYPSNVNQCICPGESPLCLVEYLLQNKIRTANSEYAVNTAIDRGCVELVDLLLQHGVEKKLMYVFLAAKSGKPVEMLKCLSSHGLSLDLTYTNKHWTPLSEACQSDYGNSLDAVKYLCTTTRLSVERNDGYLAAQSDCNPYEKVLVILKNRKVAPEGFLRVLFTRPGFPFVEASKTIPSIQTPLEIAAAYLRSDKILAMLKIGFNKGLQNGAAFKSAVQRRNWASAYTVLTFMDGAQPWVLTYCSNKMSQTIVHYLASVRRYKCLEEILAVHGGEVNMRDSLGRTPAMLIDKNANGAYETKKVLEVYSCVFLKAENRSQKKLRRKQCSHSAHSVKRGFSKAEPSCLRYYLHRSVLNQAACDCDGCLTVREQGFFDWKWLDEADEFALENPNIFTKKQGIKAKGMGRKYGGACQSQCHKTKRYTLCKSCWKTTKCACQNLQGKPNKKREKKKKASSDAPTIAIRYC
eukprot:TRINITY_DN432_c0_g1_i1.p1 TRINITY_DN432_c0_g1~~TRINITY_DN432_c0_g1_i1.p1  ORF type:complete len:650 (+),score=70.83 TRINITY_DN432_c0_g1_i1:65-1951(+)